MRWIVLGIVAAVVVVALLHGVATVASVQLAEAHTAVELADAAQ